MRSRTREIATQFLSIVLAFDEANEPSYPNGSSRLTEHGLIQSTVSQDVPTGPLSGNASLALPKRKPVVDAEGERDPKKTEVRS